MPQPYYQSGDITLYCGDNREVLPALDVAVSAVVTDPPYGLGFMGKAWDHGVPGVPFWQAIRDRMQPGAHLLAFGGTRTFHRMGVAIEDAGFEIKDTLSWLYGSGFPKHKSLLKPGWEPIILARKPGKGVLNIDACRLSSEGNKTFTERMAGNRPRDQYRTGTATGAVPTTQGRWPANVLLDVWDEQVLRLRYNIPDEVTRLIREYYRDYCRVPAMPEAHRNVSQQGETDQVLQPSVLRGVVEREPQRREPSHVRQETSARLDRQDVGGPEGEPAHGSESLQLEGRPAYSAGLRDGGPVNALPGGTNPLPVDGQSQQQQGDTGAPAGDGSALGSSAGIVGDRPSQERDQERQPAGESGIDGQRRPQEVAPCHAARNQETSGRERIALVPALHVLECDIPAGWRHYFELTGITVPAPDSTAAMLDAQSGERAAGGFPARRNNSRPGGGGTMNTGWNRPESGTRINLDTGGASRFFYVAKASRSERNAGLEGMPERACGTMEDDGYAWEGEIARGRNPRNAMRQNHHPTVKPLALMRWLLTLVTPPGGIILDPFAGSGTTLVAAAHLGIPAIGIEQSEEYCEIAARRIDHALARARQLEMVAD